MKLSTVPFVSLIIASLLCLTVADTASEVADTVDVERELYIGKKRTNFRRKRQQNQPNQQNKPNNHWNKSNNHGNKPKNDSKKLVLMESDCSYNYTSASSDDGPSDYPINDDGTLNTAGLWRPGSYVFKGCSLFNKGGTNNMYFGPVKAGNTEITCLVTKVDEPDVVGNIGFLDCTIVDSLLSNQHSKYDDGFGMESSFLNNAHMFYSSTLRSEGYMGVWNSNFKAATVGGTGGGIKASGQMNYIESATINQFVHSYYIDAPYLEKGFPW